MTPTAEETRQKPLVLFVDDQVDIREMVEVGMRHYSPAFEAAFAADREAALRVVRDRSPSAVVLDVNLVGETGMAIAEDLREHYPEVLKAVLTAYDMSATRDTAAEFGMDVWAKPITPEELIRRVEGLLASRPANATGGLAGGVSSAVVRMIAAAAGLVLGGAHAHKLQ